MNEIKRVHLGRQQFTISIEAYRILRHYLEAIESQPGVQPEVVKEVEMRMAELLGERSIDSEKVILPEDVEFLKQQLGEPGDFKDEDAEEAQNTATEENLGSSKRLYRDPKKAMVAGVASGLAAYFRVDPLIIRLIFVLLTFGGGAGIFVYVLLWILVPEAKTPSERLQMRGKAVTVDNIKQVIDRADVPGVASRATAIIGRIIIALAKVFLAVIGIGFMVVGAAALIWVLIASIYLLIHGSVSFDILFPVGLRETILLIAGLLVALTLSVTLLLVGLAMVRRKWKVPTWASASLLGLFFVAISVGAALAIDTAPNIRQRFRDAHKIETHSLQPFTSVDLAGQDVHYTFKKSDTYRADIHYVGRIDDQKVSTSVSDSVLTIDGSKTTSRSVCIALCTTKELWVTIYAPSLDHIKILGEDSTFSAYDVVSSTNLVVEMDRDSQVTFGRMNPQSVKISYLRDGRKGILLEINGTRSDQTDISDQITVRNEYAGVTKADKIHLSTRGTCDAYDTVLYLTAMPSELRVNDSAPIMSKAELLKLRNEDLSNDYNCIQV